MKELLKHLMQKVARPLINQFEPAPSGELAHNEPAARRMLWQQYRNLVQERIWKEPFPEVAVSECLNDPESCKIREEKWPVVQKFNWVTV